MIGCRLPRLSPFSKTKSLFGRGGSNRELILKWTGLREKGGGGFGVFYGISDRGEGVVLGLDKNAGPYPPLWVGGVRVFWILQDPTPPYGLNAAKNTLYNWEL